MRPVLPPRPDVAFAEYVDIDGINWSKLRALRDGSPLHYRSAVDKADTPSLRKGRAAHMAILEPHRFDADVAVFEGDERRGSKAWKLFEAENAGKTLLKRDEYVEISSMASAVRASALAAPYLDGGVAEYTVTWIDPTTRLACKGRIDWLTMVDGKLVLVDLKTARHIDEGRFGKQAQTLGYPNQLSHYTNGLAANGIHVDRVVFVVVENTPPYDVGVLFMTDEQREDAAAEVAKLLAEVAKCQLLDQWPGRYAAECPLVLPNYLKAGEFEVTYDDNEESAE